MKTAQTEVGRITRLVLKHARDAFGSDEEIERQWKGLNYLAAPGFGPAVAEYERFVEILRGLGARIDFLPQAAGVGLDSIYVRDASIVCDRGLILCNMGKPAREAEPRAQGDGFRSLGLPVIGSIEAPGTVEGGDVVWLDERTLAVGRGYRTNDAGIRQLGELLGDAIGELIVVPLPHWHGVDDVFHLMSILSPIDSDLALVYSPLMPVPFRERLLERGTRLVEVPREEFETLGTNVLSVGPGTCLALRGNPRTQRRLEQAGVRVVTYEGREISARGCGGPTCLTRPIERVGEAI